jgi:hypothetical protein
MAIGLREWDAAKKVMAVELGKKGAMAKQGKKGGDGRTRNTKSEK